MIKYDYIFLDFDGPVLDGKNRHYRCYKDILLKYGGNPVSLEQYWKMKRSRVSRRTLLELSSFAGSYDEYMNEWLTRIEQKEYLQYDKLWPNVITAIEKLKEQTKQLYLVTMRQNEENLNWQLQQLQLVKLFDRVMCCSLNQEQTKYALLKDIFFEKALFIGDTEVDIETAKLCGSEFKGVLNGLRDKQVFPKESAYPDLYQLALSL